MFISFFNQVKQFWEHTFKCKFDQVGSVETEEPLCTGMERIDAVQTEFLDLSNLRPEYNVYKAVYSLAHALHDMLQCEPKRGPFSCGTLPTLEPWQVGYQQLYVSLKQLLLPQVFVSIESY